MRGRAAWLPRSRAARQRRDRRPPAPSTPAAALRQAVGGSYAAHESLQLAALHFLALQGVPAIPVYTGPRVRSRPGGGFDLKGNPSQKGFSDVVGALPWSGRMLLVECKTGGARRSPEQIALQQRFEAAGALCVVIHNALELAPHVQRPRGQDRRNGDG